MATWTVVLFSLRSIKYTIQRWTVNKNLTTLVDSKWKKVTLWLVLSHLDSAMGTLPNSASSISSHSGEQTNMTRKSWVLLLGTPNFYCCLNFQEAQQQGGKWASLTEGEKMERIPVKQRERKIQSEKSWYSKVNWINFQDVSCFFSQTTPRQLN